ncbi:MAG: hypothetical protein JJT82_10735 [Legionellaceae bacterium]|nr:hypothetical protein [Legionellaceae bacterium]
MANHFCISSNAFALARHHRHNLGWHDISALILLSLLAFLSSPVSHAHPPISNQTSSGIVLPEPLLFDLVRPLGAHKGELELNVLGVTPASPGKVRQEYAPEIEYAFADGYGIEFELPIVREGIEAYKIALQGTFSRAPMPDMIHGWQLIALYDRQEKRGVVSGLYLIGQRYNDHWSALSMLGIAVQEGAAPALLFNPTLFYEISERLALGVEQNFYGARQDSHYLLLPQIQYQSSFHFTLQLGAGMMAMHRKAQPFAAMRLIYNT